MDLQDEMSYAPFWRGKTDLMDWLEEQDVIASRELAQKYWPLASESVPVWV